MVHCDNKVQEPQVSNQETQVSNQKPQESNQAPQISDQKPQDTNQIQRSDPITQDDLSLTFVENTLVPKNPGTTIAITATTTATTTIKTTTTPTTTTATTLPATTFKDDDIDDNTCSSDKNSEVFFEQVQIFNNEDMDCSKESNAKDTFKYPTCTAAFEACQDSTDCIGVTSTNHIIKVSTINSIQLDSEIENVEIINFHPPADFDFDHDKVFVKHCFSTIETDTSEFKELETLNCNAEIECSDGYRKKNFDCVDIDECKLDHDCTFEGKTFYLSAKANIVTILSLLKIYGTHTMGSFKKKFRS